MMGYNSSILHADSVIKYKILGNTLALFNFTESVHGSFSKVTGGRPSSFQEVTQWGTPWPRANARGTERGEVSPVG
jgi:hypothetical protein